MLFSTDATNTPYRPDNTSIVSDNNGQNQQWFSFKKKSYLTLTVRDNRRTSKPGVVGDMVVSPDVSQQPGHWSRCGPGQMASLCGVDMVSTCVCVCVF